MTINDDTTRESSESHLQGTPDEVPREAVRHEDGDLTIQGNAGKIRQVSESDGWKRYTAYLETHNIDPTAEEAWERSAPTSSCGRERERLQPAVASGGVA